MGVLMMIYNYLTECDIHIETKQRFVSNIKSNIDRYEDLPANGKFVTVMTSSSEVVIKELAKYWHSNRDCIMYSVCVIFLAFCVIMFMIVEHYVAICE